MHPATSIVLGLSLAVAGHARAAAARWRRRRSSRRSRRRSRARRFRAGWEPLTFGSLKTPTKYAFVESDGKVVVHARAEAAASGFNFPVKFDVRSAPVVEFRWKIAKLIDGADNRVAAKEDSPVRLVLGFDGDKSKLTFKEKTASMLAKSATGKDLPYAQLIYIWSNKEPVGTVIENPHTRRVRMVVAASGAADVGQVGDAHAQRRDDFKRAFGEEPGLDDRRRHHDRHRQHGRHRGRLVRRHPVRDGQAVTEIGPRTNPRRPSAASNRSGIVRPLQDPPCAASRCPSSSSRPSRSPPS